MDEINSLAGYGFMLSLSRSSVVCRFKTVSISAEVTYQGGHGVLRTTLSAIVVVFVSAAALARGDWSLFRRTLEVISSQLTH